MKRLEVLTEEKLEAKGQIDRLKESLTETEALNMLLEERMKTQDAGELFDDLRKEVSKNYGNILAKEPL